MAFVHHRSIVFAALTGAFAIAGAQASEIGRPGIAQGLCRDIMRIPEGFVPFDDCVASLTRSADARKDMLAAPTGSTSQNASFPGSDKS